MTIHDSELVARFIKFQFQVNQGFVKGEAFLPGPDKKTSVTRNAQDPVKTLDKAIKFENIRRAQPITVIGWAQTSAHSIRNNNAKPSLDVEPKASSGDPDHANIVGWDMDFTKQKFQAEEVARLSKFITRTTSS